MKTLAYINFILILACESEADFSGRSLDKKQVKVIADQEFPASLIGDMETTFRPAFGIIQDQITLKEKPLLKSKIRQINRYKFSETFLQGHDGDSVNQEFDISAAGKLDLILVIDNSGSMGEEQQELSENLKALTKHMDNVDWQIGILTTDQCNLQNAMVPMQPIKKSDADAVVNFEQTIKGLGTSGSRDEMGIKMTMLHLLGTCPTGNNSWIRKDSVLGVFFISDEENECDAGCKDDKGVAWGPDELISLMNSLRKPTELKAYALLWNRDVTGRGSHNPLCRRDAGVETYSTRIAKIVESFNGIERSICLDNSPKTNDYEPILELVSKDVSRVIRNEFELKSEPIPGSVKVSIDGASSSDISIAGRKITLKNARGDQIKLKIDYQTGPKKRFDQVQLGNPSADDSIQVLINNIDDRNYTYNDSKIIFPVRPPDRAEIKVSYRKAIPLPTSFYVGGIPIENTIKTISIGEKPSSDWIYNKDSNSIVLKTPPLDDEEIEIQHLEKNPKINSYPLPPDRPIPKRFDAFDAELKKSIPYEIEDDKITFEGEDVVEGRKIVLEYNYGDSADVLSQELAFSPLNDTLKVRSTGGSTSCIDDFKIEGKNLTFSCEGTQLGDVIVEYQYVVERYVQFKVAKQIPVEATIQVFVDKLAIKDFGWSGGIVTVPERYLQIDSKVRVIATVEESVPID